MFLTGCHDNIEYFNEMKIEYQDTLCNEVSTSMCYKMWTKVKSIELSLVIIIIKNVIYI